MSFLKCAIKAIVLNCTLCQLVGGITALLGKAKSPTRLLLLALFLASMKGFDTFSILFAFNPIVITVLNETTVNISEFRDDGNLSILFMMIVVRFTQNS